MHPGSIRTHSRATFVSLALAAVASVLAMSAQAQKIDSPLETLYAPDSMLVAGKLVDINKAGRIVVERKEVLAGKDKPPAQIDIRVAKPVLDDVKIGDVYIVGYSMYVRDPRKAVGEMLNRDGARMLNSPGLEPALFRDTQATRAILKAGRSEHGRESRKLLDLLLAALPGPDRALQNLAAGELSYAPELGERLTDADRETIDHTVRDASVPSHVRAMLLDGASRQPKTLGDWWRAAALQIVTTTPADGYSDKASDPAELVLTAFEVLDRYAVKIPPETLQRWVRNPNPPIVEQACVMLRREGPDKERSAIQLALADPKLPETTRKFLNDHLRRLDRIDERAKARKEGSG